MTRTTPRWRPSRRTTLIAVAVALVASVVWWADRPAHAVSSSGVRLCDTLTADERRALVGFDTVQDSETAAGGSHPATCAWRDPHEDVVLEVDWMPAATYGRWLLTVSSLTPGVTVTRAEVAEVLDDVPDHDTCRLFTAMGHLGGVTQVGYGQSAQGVSSVFSSECKDGQVTALAAQGMVLVTDSDIQAEFTNQLHVLQQRLG